MKMTDRRGAILAVFVFLFAAPSTGLAQEMESLLELQGEYTGEVNTPDGLQKAGVQVISRGDDEFEMTVYLGGLPGDGWSADMDRDTENTGRLENGVLEFTRDNERIAIEDGILTYFRDDEEAGQLKRVQRESETLGKQPPKDAIVLFDGSTGDHFLARNDKAPMVDGLLRQGVTSKQSFDGDFRLHIEFKLPFEPSKSGQGRGNSGIYVQGRYEVQMLDSFGLTGEHNECGGIYSVKKPDVNMCYPPEAWQTYDIEFKSAKWDGDRKTENARMTVYHNGVLIHDDVEVPKTTTAAPLKETAEAGYIYLQDHGSPVRYRNIWVVQD